MSGRLAAEAAMVEALESVELTQDEGVPRDAANPVAWKAKVAEVHHEGDEDRVVAVWQFGGSDWGDSAGESVVRLPNVYRYVIEVSFPVLDRLRDVVDKMAAALVKAEYVGSVSLGEVRRIDESGYVAVVELAMVLKLRP